MVAKPTAVSRGGAPPTRRPRPLSDAHQASRRRWEPRMGAVLLALALAFVAAGCNGLLQNDELPPEVTDPAITKTPQGALAAYNGTIAEFGVYGGQDEFVQVTGLFSDELHVLPGQNFTHYDLPQEDARVLTETNQGVVKIYRNLQRVRGQAGQAIGLLTDYRSEDLALRGHIYALAGYAEVLLAELFCSGIPLSTLDYHGEYTLQPGSSTAAVFTHAAALFDSALALAGDSAAFLDLARVGQARALLALGRYAAAAAVVGTVPDGYIYTLNYTANSTTAYPAGVRNFADSSNYFANVADMEGLNGLDYRTSGDPRTSVRRVQFSNISTGIYDSIWFPAKYATNGSSSLVLASGVEARLIEAEAALQAGHITTWRDKLNALRTDGTQDGSGTYNPGSGGVAGLAPLADPGTDAGRVNLLFRERAFWLFLTGHRQGDLRRLIRQYGRTQDQVYPSGSTGAGNYPFYDSDVTAPIPADERVLNPQFTGCISRNA